MSKEKYSLIFSVAVFFLFCWLAWEARNFAKLASMFPMYIAIVAAVLSLIDIVIKLIKIKDSQKDEKPVHENPLLAVKYILWIIGCLVLIYLFGFLIGTAIFLFGFLIIETKFGILKASVSVVITVGALMLFAEMMTLYWPEGLFNII